MMKISEIENCIPMALALFKRKFPDAEIPEITVLQASKITKDRELIYKECGDNGLVECDSLYGEYVHGPHGSRIIIYQNMFDSPLTYLKQFGMSWDTLYSVRKKNMELITMPVPSHTVDTFYLASLLPNT